jgi:AcrR family transcriptional regulator
VELFLQYGIGAVGISRLIAEADVALMTLYRQFGGKDNFDRLWTALEDWLTSKEFCGSLVAIAATELRGKPQHPAHQAIFEHRMAMRQLLEDLAKLADAPDPAALAAQLHVLVEGAVAVAIVDRQSGHAPSVRALASTALAKKSSY